MRFTTPHDVNGDGKDDVYLHHELPNVNVAEGIKETIFGIALLFALAFALGCFLLVGDSVGYLNTCFLIPIGLLLISSFKMGVRNSCVWIGYVSTIWVLTIAWRATSWSWLIGLPVIIVIAVVFGEYFLRLEKRSSAVDRYMASRSDAETHVKHQTRNAKGRCLRCGSPLRQRKCHCGYTER